MEVRTASSSDWNETAATPWRLDRALALNETCEQLGGAADVKDNAVGVLTFAGAALAALLGATGKLDGLAGVDIGLFIGWSITFAAITGASGLIVKVFRVGEKGTLWPRSSCCGGE